MSRSLCPKDPKKTEMQKAQKLKTPEANVEGQTVEAFEKMMSNVKGTHVLHDTVKKEYAFTVPEFLKYVPKSIRLPVPIRENRRLRIGKDEEYFPGQNINMENSDYYFVQAPVKGTARMLWKAVQQECIRLIVCLCHDAQMTTGDDVSKCFTYFPTKPEQSLIFDQTKGTFTIVCKSREELNMGAIRYQLELIDSETVIDRNSDDPNAANERTLKVVLLHMNTWNGQTPETGNQLGNAGNVAAFSRTVKKHEMTILRKSMESYAPPVLIQSFDGINRSAILWVALMLLKDCEMRECFDVPILMKSIMQKRIGSLSTYFQFCFCVAVCLNIGKDMKWCETECTSALTDLNNKFGSDISLISK